MIDPWGIFNPKKFISIVLLITAIEYFSFYVATKIKGQASNLVIGFLSGLISSTVLILSAAKLARINPDAWRPLTIRAMSGQLASISEMFVIVVIAAPTLFVPLAALVFAPIAVGAGTIIFLSRPEECPSFPFPPAPPSLQAVMRLSVFLALILGLIAVGQKHAGNFGRLASAGISGLFELHALSLATATLFTEGQIETRQALRMLVTAMCASLGAKTILALIRGGGKFGVAVTLFSVTLACLAIAGAWVGFA